MSYLSLLVDSLSFTITKAHIKESLESPFHITCEGYIENLKEHPFASISHHSHTALASHHSSFAPNFHPNALINKQATFKIQNPYPQNLSKILHLATTANSPHIKNHKDSALSADSKDSLLDIKEYQGILSFVEYQGLNTQSSSNVLNRGNQTSFFAHKHFFSFTLSSPLYRMSLNKANRIYTNKNIIEVIQATLGFYEQDLHKPLDFSHIHLSYPRLELITQYQESDLDFITRLAHNNGIYFYDNTQSICFYDMTQAHSPREITFNPNANNTFNEPCISSIYKEQSLQANAFTQSSANALNPLSLQSVSLRNDLSPQDTYKDAAFIYNEHSYETQSSFSQNNDLKTLLSLKEKRLQVLEQSIKAQSNIIDLALHNCITLNLSSTLKENKENLKDFIIIGMEQILLDKAILENNFNSNDNAVKKSTTQHINNNKNPNTSHSTYSAAFHHSKTLDSTTAESTPYVNTLTLLPVSFSFAPALRNKPKAPHSTLGVVIGESENIERERNTIYTDDYGRVRVRINCFANQEIIDNARINLISDKQEQNNTQDTNSDSTSQQKSYCYHYSPYLRVSSPLASISSGLYYTPRVGDEVIISFFDDDIDKPYISGSLYNQSNPTLHSLPLHTHQTSLSARTLNNDSNNTNNANATSSYTDPIESGFNEITLSNLKDKEQVYIQAQKDYEELIKHNFKQNIHNNKESQVDGAYTERIKKIHTQTIDLAKQVYVGAEYFTQVGLYKDTQVGGNHTLSIGANHTLQVAGESKEHIGGDKHTEIQGSRVESIQGDFNESVGGDKREVVSKHLSIHSDENFHLSANDELALSSQKNLHLLTKESLALRSDENLTLNVKDLYAKAKQQINYYADTSIKLCIAETSSISLEENRIVFKVKDSELILDENGFSINGLVNVKGK